MNLSDVPIWVL